MPRYFAVATAALAAAGCASIPLSSIPALSRIDFQTTDFSRLRVAVQLPVAIRARADGVRMVATVRIDREPSREETLLLVESSPGPEAPPAARAGVHGRVFSLRVADIARLNAIRAEILAKKADGRRGSIGVGIEAREFCRDSEIGSGPISMSTFLQTSENPGFVPLLRDYDLRSDARVRDSLATLQPC
jgi:hypothetical protein